MSYAATMAELEGMGIPTDKAESRARELYPHEAIQADKATERRANVLEKDEQRTIRKMAIAVGFKVYWLSQAKASGQTPGLADLWIAHPGRQLAAWWETKRQVGGKRSRVQEDFAAECVSCLIPYGFGDRYEFARWLTEHGITPPAIPK